MIETKVAKKSVALTAIERKIIERVSRKRGLNNFSAALRLIVRDWNDNKAHWVGTEPKAKQAGESGASVAEEVES